MIFDIIEIMQSNEIKIGVTLKFAYVNTSMIK